MSKKTLRTFYKNFYLPTAEEQKVTKALEYQIKNSKKGKKLVKKIKFLAKVWIIPEMIFVKNLPTAEGLRTGGQYIFPKVFTTGQPADKKILFGAKQPLPASFYTASALIQYEWT